jgi:DNA-binding response OmpR family regulator
MGESMYKLLIIEDDEKLQSLLKEYLEKYGYCVSTITRVFDSCIIKKSLKALK